MAAPRGQCGTFGPFARGAGALPAPAGRILLPLGLPGGAAGFAQDRIEFGQQSAEGRGCGVTARRQRGDPGFQARQLGLRGLRSCQQACLFAVGAVPGLLGGVARQFGAAQLPFAGVECLEVRLQQALLGRQPGAAAVAAGRLLRQRTGAQFVLELDDGVQQAAALFLECAQAFGGAFHGGALLRLFVEVVALFAAALAHFLGHLVEQGMQARILVAVRVLFAAAHRAGRVVGEAVAQAFHAVGAGQLRRLQQALGLGQRGIDRAAGVARGFERLGRSCPGGLLAFGLGVQLAQLLVRRRQGIAGGGEGGQSLAPGFQRAALTAQGVGIEAVERGNSCCGLRTRGLALAQQRGGGTKGGCRALGAGFGLFQTAAGGGQCAGAVGVQGGGLLGLHQALLPARPLGGQAIQVAPRVQPGAGIQQRLARAVQFDRLGLQAGSGLARLGGGAIACLACLDEGRGQRGQGGVERLGAVQQGGMRLLGIDCRIQLALGLDPALRRQLLRFQRACQVLVAVFHGQLGLALLGGQALQVGHQRARRLHRIQGGQVASARAGVVGGRRGLGQRRLGLGDALGQAFQFLVPAQLLFERTAHGIGGGQRIPGGDVFGVERGARLRRRSGGAWLPARCASARRRGARSRCKPRCR
jgi:hypothetical protein